MLTRNRRTKPPRYGMRHSTIRYWQSTADSLLRMRGPAIFRAHAHFRQEDTIGRLAKMMDTADARNIAHTCIMLAHVGHLDMARIIKGR